MTYDDKLSLLMRGIWLEDDLAEQIASKLSADDVTKLVAVVKRQVDEAATAARSTERDRTQGEGRIRTNGMNLTAGTKPARRPAPLSGRKSGVNMSLEHVTQMDFAKLASDPSVVCLVVMVDPIRRPTPA